MPVRMHVVWCTRRREDDRCERATCDLAQVVETSSMSAVQPPDPHYKLALPRRLIEGGLLSGALQLAGGMRALRVRMRNPSPR